jgi:hypothetical protein
MFATRESSPWVYILAISPPCLPEGENYHLAFEHHFDRSPPIIQKMYCHLSRIMIEKSFSATAYAQLDTDSSGKVIGGIVGIRKELLGNPMKFDEWLSWKEESSFGGLLQ